MSKSTKSGKPAKPYESFPLFPHATKRWAKKIKGRMHYFGSWEAGWEKALTRYEDEKADLYAGRTPRKKGGGLTVLDLCDRFIGWKAGMVKSGDLEHNTLADYGRTTARLVEHFGPNRLVSDLRPDDFERLRAELSKTRGAKSMASEIIRCRCVFGYAYKSDLIPAPVKYGLGFALPSKATLRKARAEQGPRLFTAKEIYQMLTEADLELRAMLLLGINCGLGPMDLARLEAKHLDLKGGWLDFPRPKTGVHRRAELWQETVTAIEVWLAFKAEAEGGKVFINAGNRLSHTTGKLLRKLGINGRKRLGFYALRHTFLTVAEGGRDFVAVRMVMGHSDSSMAGHYRESIGDDRLEAVAELVHQWLYGA